MSSLASLWASPTYGKIVATLNYLKRLSQYQSDKPYILALDISIEDEAARSNLIFEDVEVSVANLRPEQHSISIEEHGFELFEITPAYIDKYFNQLDPISNCEGVQKLLSKRLNAEKVVVYDHAVSVQ
ncbi:hypothetical protein O1611_g3515 [Lasiodiplodia mahajangana]|uniref:Uncharacterized protein n=1 Tax=Lasiodiplodia mahajangana TaxID=1108764 RepID=A0ACC2JRI0_9PEZI|nr:hypothetical protein O1611_g3515 [Lasiodiplodia mahajangana]